jgi:hypothetical protein
VHRRGQRIHYVTPSLEPGIQKTLDCRVKPGSSERLLMKQLDYNLLFRWFVGLGIDDPVWHPTAFTTNRDRLLAGEVAARLLASVLNHPQVRGLLSREHFTVDGTLVEAWASLKSFRPKDERDDPPGGGRNTSRDFHGEGRTNDSHASTTDPDARLFRKGRGKEARLCFMVHVLMENRHALVVEAELTRAAGFAERRAAVELVGARAGMGPITGRRRLGLRYRRFGHGAARARSHAARRPEHRGRRSAIVRRITWHAGYRQSSGRSIGSRRCSPGSRPSPGRARPSIAASIGCAGTSRSPRPPTT